MSKKIWIAILLFCINSAFAESRAPDFGLSPFIVNGYGVNLGVEFNRWYMGVDPGLSPENNGKTPLSRTFFSGYGARFYSTYYRHAFGVWTSPMLSISYVGLGLSASPDLGYDDGHLDYGYSIRAWFLLFGAEFRWTKETDQRLGFYFYYPLHCPICDYW
ncbi:MAG: hypothetical protein HUK20_08020 [Fibrobacter sp.]|nr:hypothetical protein [Fibrobacter sp.]